MPLECEVQKLLETYQKEVQARSNCRADTEHPDKKICSGLPCGCNHPEFYWIEEDGDECCYYCRKNSYCRCVEEESDDETTYITHISDGIETDKGTKTIYTKEEYVQKGYWQSDENPDNLEFRLILLNQHSK